MIAPPFGQRRLDHQIRRVEPLSLHTVQSRPAANPSLQHEPGTGQGVFRIRVLTQSAFLLPITAPCPPSGDEEVPGQ